MKLDLLNAVAKEIQTDLNKDGVTCTYYYFYESSWFELPTSNKIDHKILLILEKAKAEEIAYHAPSDTQSWFYFDTLDMVVNVDFTVSPKLVTRRNTRNEIDDSIRNATNAYKVSHNPLTELLSKDAFRLEVENEINLANQTAKASASEGQQQKTIAVLAFDIDKFKQVNDTYGHLYGDQVLKAFSLRLEEVKSDVQKQYGESIRVILGHPSGEEFLALVVGTSIIDEIREIAEKFRQVIAEKPLPDENEWALLSKQTGLSNVVPPPLHERKVTASVGITSYAGESGSSMGSLVLIDKADAALYRSKSGGRNRVTHFDEILQDCGRVLEFDPETGVAAIDIGNKVGVSIGQEFRVFSPIYSGVTPFTVDDGRSKRTLGFYPRVEICRMIIINVQPEMSFGEVIHEGSGGFSAKKIPTGAILEAVPLGNISHLIEHPKKLGNSILGIGSSGVLGGSELQEEINKIITKGEGSPFAAVFRFKNEQAFVRKYGSASLNRALAKLYSGSIASFPSTVMAGVIDRTSVCIVGIASLFKPDEIATMFAEKFPADSELEPVCGYYHPNCGLPEKSGIEFARYAASDNSDPQLNNIREFSVKVAEKILSQHRSTRSFNAAIVDYLRLKELGVSSGDFENYAGLCYSALKDNVRAWDCYRRAIEAQPQHATYIGNYGIIANRLGEIGEGLKAFSKIKKTDLNKLAKSHPYAYVVYAKFLAEAKVQKLASFDAELFKEIGVKAITLGEDGTWEKEKEIIKSILALG